jgi:hypothetical protein
MTRRRDSGRCEHCDKAFGYYLIDNGFNNSAYAYCDKCGITALLDAVKSSKETPALPHEAITSQFEPYLAPCVCGGRFSASASPRCMHCHEPLSADFASRYIELHAEGVKKGWQWQSSWTGLYCIIIADRFVHNVWR